MLVATKAIVFSSLKYSDADIISTCYTEVSGIKSYLIRGILKSKKGKLKTSYFQPLTQLELIAQHKNKASLEYIKEAKVINPYQNLHTQIVKSGMVLFLSEILKNCIREEEANPQLYHYLEQACQWLDTHDEIANFHILFLLKLSAHLGFYPDASNSQASYFNVMEGNFQSTNTSIYCIEGPQVENLKKFFLLNFGELYTVKLARQERHALLELILTYYSYHVQGYRTPKSLAVLHQLFS